MTKVNIIFDNALDDVDIIVVPDDIVFKIDELVQEFLYWIPSAKDSDYWTIVNGRKYLVAETDGFIKWLNTRYCQKTEKAYVFARNTNICQNYKIIEF